MWGLLNVTALVDLALQFSLCFLSIEQIVILYSFIYIIYIKTIENKKAKKTETTGCSNKLRW